MFSYGKQGNKKKIWDNLAELCGRSRCNPANNTEGEDRGGRLAGVYNAEMDLRLSGGPAGFLSLRKETDLWLYEEDGARWGEVLGYIYCLGGPMA